MTDLDLYPAYRLLVVAIFLRAVRDLRTWNNVTRYDRLEADSFLRSKEVAELLDDFGLDSRLAKWAVEKWGVKAQKELRPNRGQSALNDLFITQTA